MPLFYFNGCKQINQKHIYLRYKFFNLLCSVICWNPRHAVLIRSAEATGTTVVTGIPVSDMAGCWVRLLAVFCCPFGCNAVHTEQTSWALPAALVCAQDRVWQTGRCCVVTRFLHGRYEVRVSAEQDISFCSKCPDRLWGRPAHLPVKWVQGLRRPVLESDRSPASSA